MTKSDLPTWDGPRGGSGCDSDDCTAADQYCRVLSREEIEVVYPRPERLPMWPLPDAYDYMCTACGKGYVAGDLFPSLGDGTDTSGRPVPDIDAWDWDPEKQYDGTIREAVEAFVAGAPADAEVAEIAEGVDRYVTGADASLAREVLVADDEADATADPADEYV